MKRELNAAATSSQIDAMPVRLPDEEFEMRNDYYLTVSRRFKMARLLMLALLVIYILTMLTFYADDITVANFKYLLRDINISSSSGDAFSEVNYTAEPIQRFGIYRGELLYVTGSEAKLYSRTGNMGLSAELSYEAPTVLTTDKYVFIYDTGGDTFSLYNSFSELYRESTEYYIISADISEGGSFAVLTSGREYKSIVYLYNDSFELSARYLKKDYVTDVALSGDGTRLVLSAVESSAGGFSSKLYYYEPGMDSELTTVTVTDDYVTSLERMTNGFAALGVKGIYFYDTNGAFVSRCVYGEELGMYSVSNENAVLILPVNTLGNVNRVIILSDTGEVVYNKVLEEKITDVSVSDYGDVYVLTASRAVMIDIDTGTEKSVPVAGNAKRLFAIGEKTALYCTASSAYAVDFSGLSDITG